MNYVAELVVPANTLQTAPVRHELLLTWGIIEHVEIIFPPGCAAVVHVYIKYHEFYLYPSNPDADYTGDNVTISFRDNFPINEAPYSVDIYGWSEAQDYEHTPIIRLNVLLPELALGGLLFGGAPVIEQPVLEGVA